jgi:hypothetical protein
MAKKQRIDMGDYLPKENDYKAFKFCVDNNIRIYPIPESTIKWSVEIDINGKKSKSPESFPKVVIWQKIWEYYQYYYKKYENKV